MEKKTVSVKAVNVLPSAARTIRVNRDETPITIKGEVIGTVYGDHFAGEGAQKVMFRSGDQKPKTIGLVSDKFEITNHDDVLGFVSDNFAHCEPTVIKQIRGGLGIFAIYKLANTEQQDPINWDHSFFPEVSRNIASIFRAIIVRSDIREGHGITISGGWYRLICTNGLTIPVRDVSIRIFHNQWATRENRIPEMGVLENIPELGTGQGAERLANKLMTVKTMQRAGELPSHLQDPFSPFLRLPAWYQDSLADQLFAMAMVEDRNLNYLDVANAVTTPLFHEDRGTRFLPIQDSITSFIGNILTYYSV